MMTSKKSASLRTVSKVAGMGETGEAVVDLVATQLMQHEHGEPKVPRQILISPTWIEGASIRPNNVPH